MIVNTMGEMTQAQRWNEKNFFAHRKNPNPVVTTAELLIGELYEYRSTYSVGRVYGVVTKESEARYNFDAAKYGSFWYSSQVEGVTLFTGDIFVVLGWWGREAGAFPGHPTRVLIPGKNGTDATVGWVAFEPTTPFQVYSRS